MARLAGPNPSRNIPELESVTAHVQDLLNTSLGSCKMSEEIGLIPIADLIHDFPLATSSLETSIHTTIETQEPRLQSLRVTVTHQEEDMVIHIEITGRLGDQTGQEVQLASTLDHRGRLHLS